MGLQSRRYEGMKPWVGFMKWDIPDPACGEGKYTHTNTHSNTLYADAAISSSCGITNTNP